MTEGTETARVAAVNLKLPPFRPSDPEVWFAQVEAQFATRGITQQKTKFDYIVASLSPEYATEVRDLILRPPDVRPYDTLREQLVRRTAASERRCLQQLLTTEELGDRKPSQLLRRMQQLLEDRAAATDGAFVRELSYSICLRTCEWSSPQGCLPARRPHHGGRAFSYRGHHSHHRPAPGD